MVKVSDVVDIARDAGTAVLEVYGRNDFGERLKSDDSPLTEADLASHRLIVERLVQLTPNIPILSEESADIPWEERKQWNEYWLIDPLDGTKEFLKRNGEFTVNIALIKDNEPVMGVVHAPVLQETWFADTNGAWKLVSEDPVDAAEPIAVTTHEQNQKWKVVGSRSHAGDSLKAFLAELGEYELISMGSSIKLCLVAEGKAHIYPRLGPTSEWDTAAAHAVVNAAGGKIVVADSGKTLRYNTKDSLLNPFFIVQA